MCAWSLTNWGPTCLSAPLAKEMQYTAQFWFTSTNMTGNVNGENVGESAAVGELVGSSDSTCIGSVNGSTRFHDSDIATNGNNFAGSLLDLIQFSGTADVSKYLKARSGVGTASTTKGGYVLGSSGGVGAAVGGTPVPTGPLPNTNTLAGTSWASINLSATIAEDQFILAKDGPVLGIEISWRAEECSGGTRTFSIGGNSNNVVLWYTTSKVTQVSLPVIETVLDEDSHTTNYWIQGTNASSSMCDFWFTHEYTNDGMVARESASGTVVRAELEAEDLDGTVAATNEMNPGAFIHFNCDNDDDSDNSVGGTKYPGGDCCETNSVTGEDDLKELAFSLNPELAAGYAVLTIENGRAVVWKNEEKGSSSDVVLAGPGTKTWDLSDSGEKSEFDGLSSVWVEGVATGTCHITLSYKNPSGTVIDSNSVKYTFVAAVCGDQPTTTPPADVRGVVETFFTNIVHCEWSVTGEPDPAYNCIGWVVGETTNFYADVFTNSAPGDIVIDQEWGDDDGTLSTSEIDSFFLEKGYVPTATGPSDATIMYYGTGFHAARKKDCECGAGLWNMFESKLGPEHRIEHVYNQLDGSTYGSPTRFYKEAP